MSALVRAALVGAVVGIAEAMLYVFGDADEIPVVLAMALLPFPLGMFLSWFGRLPLSWAVSTLASFLLYVLMLAFAVFGLTLSTAMDFGAVTGTAAFMALGVIGYVAAAAIVMPGPARARSLAAGFVAVTCLGLGAPHDLIAAGAQAERLHRAGLPLVGPGLDGFRLTHADDDYTGHPDEPELHLTYEGEGTMIEVRVLRPDLTGPYLACEYDSGADCRQVRDGVWMDRYRVMYASRGGTTVRLEGETASYDTLLAMLDTFRPIPLTELAAADRP
ncbi:hypothetical protein [Nonomuraea ceibae]|uniref:hypothetical protein n=1 Tax=Nonomuraea ceibae TaxID=1935170 RepID=UPI001C5EECE4|nr:hypothetical protein [Nonomuraea ceibae]